MWLSWIGEVDRQIPAPKDVFLSGDLRLALSLLCLDKFTNGDLQYRVSRGSFTVDSQRTAPQLSLKGTRDLDWV